MPKLENKIFHFPNLDKIHIILTNSSLDLHINAQDREQELAKIIKSQKRSLGSLFEAHQIHTNQLIYTEYYQKNEFPKADGLATNQARQGLMIKTADCQAILLAHSSQKYILALHVGWRGNRINFIQSAIQDFCEHYRLQASELFALRSASLGPCNAKFTNFDEEWGNEFIKYYNPDKQTMDLWALSRDQLLNTGLKLENIFEIEECTYDLQDKYHSYRRDKTTKRQASIIWISLG